MRAYPGIPSRGSIWRRTLIGEALLCLAASLAAAGVGTLGAGMLRDPAADPEPGIRARAAFYAASPAGAPGAQPVAAPGCDDGAPGCERRTPGACPDEAGGTCAEIYMAGLPASPAPEAPLNTREI